MEAVATRGDIRQLPTPLRQQLTRLAGRPHSTLPIQAFAEADQASSLFQYYLLDTHNFEPNVFTARFPGINDQVDLTVTGADCGLPTIGAVRLVVEPKPDLPRDPNDVRAFIDVFTDIHPLFVINNESGWYEGWMIHDLRVALRSPRPARTDTRSSGRSWHADADRLQAMGAGNDVPGHLFTTDGNAVQFPSESDHFPDVHGNLVPIYLSMGAYNALQQSDVHSYWEFNYTTDWVFPLYELPFTGGIPGTFEAGQIGAGSSLDPRLGAFGHPERPGALRRQPVPAARPRQVRRRGRRAARVPRPFHPERPGERDLSRRLRARWRPSSLD